MVAVSVMGGPMNGPGGNQGRARRPGYRSALTRPSLRPTVRVALMSLW